MLMIYSRRGVSRPDLAPGFLERSVRRWYFGLNDSSLEGNGFEISVPRQIGSGFEASVGLGPIDSRRGKITRAVVGLGKPIVFRRLKEPPLTRRNEGAHAVGGGEASQN